MKTRNEMLQRAGIAVLLSVFTIFLSMQSEMAPFSNGISGTDSSVFLYIAQMMRRGSVPYRDMFDHKGPLLYLIDCLGILLYPRKGVWLMEIAALFGAVWYSWRTARLYMGRAAALFGVITAYALLGDCFRGGNLTEEYALAFIAAGLYVFLNYFRKKKITKCGIFCCGICFSAVCLLRVNMIAVWVVCIWLVLFRNILNKRWKEIGGELILFSAGSVTLAAPVLFYLLWNHAFGDFWNSYIRFNVSYSGYADMRARLDCYRFFIDQPLVYLAIFGFLYLGYRVRKAKEELPIDRWGFAAAAGSFIVTFPFMCMSGRNDITYEMVLIPVLVLPVGFVFSFLLDARDREGKSPATLSAVSCLAVFGVITMTVIPLLLRVWDNGLERNRYLTRTPDDLWLQRVQTEIGQYCGEGDTISVFGNQDIIYLLSGRESASRYSYQFPIVEMRREIYGEYVKELAQNVPRIIVINEPFAEEYVDIFRQWLGENGYEALDSQETIYLKR